jgi:hypothetical protein
MRLRLLGDGARWLGGRRARRAASAAEVDAAGRRSERSADSQRAAGRGSHRRPGRRSWRVPASTPPGTGPRGVIGAGVTGAGAAGAGAVGAGTLGAGAAGVEPAATRPAGPGTTGRHYSPSVPRPGGLAERPASGPAGTARAAVRIAGATPASTARTSPQHAGRAAPVRPASGVAAKAPAATATPWYEAATADRGGPALRHCGSLEAVLHRDWAPGAQLAAEVVTAIRRLAELPQVIKDKLVAGLDAIYVGAGGVPDLDDMGKLKGVPLPSGRATWDACAGAYGNGKIIIGTRPSPTPDVTCHEVGHALDDLDGSGGWWQSDSAAFRDVYKRCQPCMASEFHSQEGEVGRREFFADAFAAIASGQRPALVDMLAGDTRSALDVMLYFNVRYGM